ncbi:transcriptional regulator with XRE-family HTH domain [Microbacteriaceae bacterium SG_E_30_P1]|uniref:Transcriptional regulator with XRE-family HTH domain n=1 Tax=Antiquaquibacter oligotrophicus TaxID=2880260 RepID=A0ABT6KLT4_9MICO|nr:helix-turn-helix transcriptional regulator [Antiquaquibacter oligotrophicus]MDH6180092.1 transcriptional regulator with XRE-family HTH domain [Antiquaquibacter oligotrophicus]UDF14157.1 helix-turn-helix transcriptional regulator [Antiquaquibacter oligotrophicus]
MSYEPNILGDYLRARRELVTPEQVGIPVLGVRRVPGLRREEVAMLSGISAEYYLRLEQGRDRRPSTQVLEAIARVLRLDDSSYLLGLVADRPSRRPSGRLSGRRTRPRRESLPASTERFIAELPLPAFAEGRYLDVLAANPLATAISPRLVVGGNRLRDVFLDEAEQDLFSDGERAAAALLAGFRRSVGNRVDDPRVVELVGELSLASPAFRRLWARHDVAERTGATVLLSHPVVGELRLDREKLSVSGTDGIMLVVYHAQPGSESAERLALLGSMVADTTARVGSGVSASTAHDVSHRT